MVRHLGMLYNTVGIVIKDITKAMSYRFVPGGEKQNGGVEIDRGFFEEVMERKEFMRQIRLELES